MKVFISSGSWTGKVNFIDKNNVLVGYDTSQSCCEHAGWYLSPYAKNSVKGTAIVSGDDEGWIPDEDGLKFFSGWAFDTEFCQSTDVDESCYNEENEAVFRMTKGNKEQFLHLFNHHNGYYSHGFTVEKDDKVIREGSL